MVYTSAYRKIIDTYQEFGYELKTRVKRSSGSPIYADGVTLVSNRTSCHHDVKRNSTEDCTITKQYTDIKDHEYYRSIYYPKGDNYFVDLVKQGKLENMDVEKHENLSNSYKKAFRIPIDFHFPFYGNYVDKIIVTTGGFINIGPKFHSFVHRVHYIAPLMADFNPRPNNRSIVFIGRNKNLVIVQWTDFLLNGKQNIDKQFTFQISLHKNGTVIMAYKDIPMPLSEIKQGNVDVTVGFSDGFIITFKRYEHIKMVVHNVIYSYHKVNFPLAKIVSGAAYKLVLLPNCIQFKTCISCLNDSKYTTNFTCRWCPKLNQCSDALDWHRQKWMEHCKDTSYIEPNKCKAVNDKIKSLKKRNSKGSTVSTAAGMVIGLLLFIVLVVLVSVFIYAYTHPLSKPGIFLIENRRPWKRLQKVPDAEEVFI